MVWIYEAIQDDVSCVGWRLLPLIILEGCLLLTILWRIIHQVYWKSHPRRIFFHVVLWLSCLLRLVYWFSLCHISMFAIGTALVWLSNSLILLCTASIIVQWWCAVSAGRVAVREFQKVKRFSLTHPLVLFHLVHLLGSLVGGIFFIIWNATTQEELQDQVKRAKIFLILYRSLNVAIVIVDAIVAIVVARRLRERLMSAAMSDEMKKKSVIQMTFLIIIITVSLTIQCIMDVPVLILGLEKGFGHLTLSQYGLIKYFISGLFLSLAFLYIMRRVEQREPVRLVTAPATSSIVEYEECSSPCMWCEHHRRFNVGQNKWDVTFMPSFSPRTVDSSFQSVSGMHGPMSAAIPSEFETPVFWSNEEIQMQYHRHHRADTGVSHSHRYSHRHGPAIA